VEVVAVPRRVQTLLFTDIVGSTDRLRELGDAPWAALLARHHSVIRDVLAAHGGREVNTAGDAFLARFEAPPQRCGRRQQRWQRWRRWGSRSAPGCTRAR
jgi:class 3 adenylate cyclase